MVEPSNFQPTLKHLFLAFVRLGLTAFGGPSMIAYIRKVSVDQKHWLDADTFDDGVALCQMIPGATAMQTAAYVGLKTRGVIGAITGYIGFGLPAFFLMMTFAALFTFAHSLPAVVSAFQGLQAIIVAIVANATISFGKTSLKTWKHLLIAGFAAVLFGLNVNPLVVIFLAGIVGLALIRPKQFSQRKIALASQTFPYIKPFLLIIAVALLGFLLLYIFDRDLFYLAMLLARIDLTAFGGGFASIPLMLHEIVDVRHWMDAPTFMNGIVLGQVTPGPIVITATFIGYLLHGPLGGLIATISIFLPSFLMVLGISPFFDRLRVSIPFNQAIGGVLCSFVGLLFTVIFRFAGNVSWNLQLLLIACGALIALLLKIDVFWVVLIGSIVSVILLI
ncbi:MAG: chromate efflux transporter [Chloroflexi bacterium]|nr:chromate efflux transporter [Chloroflexota bacterium]